MQIKGNRYNEDNDGKASQTKTDQPMVVNRGSLVPYS